MKADLSEKETLESERAEHEEEARQKSMLIGERTAVSPAPGPVRFRGRRRDEGPFPCTLRSAFPRFRISVRSYTLPVCSE